MQPQAFDTYAGSYDSHFTHSLIGQEQRKQVWKYIHRYKLYSRNRVLEINCGTGEDAIKLANLNANVLATDISEKMIQQAQSKAGAANIEFRVMKIQDTQALLPQKFEFLFSNFGGLNCLSPQELTDFSVSAASLQKSGAMMLLVVMGTKCSWEQLFFMLRKQPEKAFRRLSADGILTQLPDAQFTTWYYSPTAIKQLFAPHYTCLETVPIGLFVPPSYLEPLMQKHKALFKCLVWLDTIFGKISWLANRSDHFLVLLQRK